MGGLQKGTPNKATAEVKLVAQAQMEAGDHVAPECLPPLTRSGAPSPG